VTESKPLISEIAEDISLCFSICIRYLAAIRVGAGSRLDHGCARLLLMIFGVLGLLVMQVPSAMAAEALIRGGELHSGRIPKAHWPHRLRMAKALGLTAVSTYVFWSQHEPEPGKFD
jgi:hypothetical protein